MLSIFNDFLNIFIGNAEAEAEAASARTMLMAGQIRIVF